MFSFSVILTPLLEPNVWQGAGDGQIALMWYAMASINVSVCVCMCCLVFLVYWANSITNKSVRQAVKNTTRTTLLPLRFTFLKSGRAGTWVECLPFVSK